MNKGNEKISWWYYVVVECINSRVEKNLIKQSLKCNYYFNKEVQMYKLFFIE